MRGPRSGLASGVVRPLLTWGQFASMRAVVRTAPRCAASLQSARRASVRADRQIAILRILESLRIYAANHEGHLPQQLSDITEVPIPDDPVTGQPFEYKLEGDRALLQGPTLMLVPLNYEITMAPND